MRLHDGAMGSLKIVRLSNAAFRLWIKGLCYCQLNLTDGLIPREALHGLEAKRAEVDMLCRVLVDGKQALWEPIAGFGFKVHDYLDFNDSKEAVEKKRLDAKQRVSDSRARALVRNAERAPSVTRNVTRTFPLVRFSTSDLEEKESGMSERAGRLIERYQALYATHRNGARLRIIGNPLEYQDSVSLCQLWDDAHLEKLAVIILTTDDDWISRTDRSFKIFASKASWADDKLKDWEAKHKVSA